jgi:hypothetical protein
VRGCGADESGRAVDVAANRRDSRETEQALGGEGTHDQLAAQREFLAEGVVAASVSPVSSAASPKFPWTSIQEKGWSRSRARGSADSAKSFASRSLPSHNAP